MSMPISRVVVQTAVSGPLQQPTQMVDVAVDAAVGDQSHEVDASAVGLGVGDGVLECLNFEEGPVADGEADAGEVLVDDAPGADVEVPHFAVAHLAFGQAHGLTVGGQGGVGMLLHQPI